MVDVGEELLCALDFTFLQGEVSLPRRGRKPEELLIHDLERTFDWTRHSGVTVFPSARGSKNRYPAEGVSPRGCWFTTWGERSDWTRTSEAKIFRAREETKIFASPRAQARGVTGSSQRNVYSKNPQGGALRILALCAPPTGLEPVTLRLTVECSAN